jgi:hypothetical protein
VEIWGRGEMSGWLANFKSLTWICAPQLYALAYSLGTRGGGTFHGKWCPSWLQTVFVDSNPSHSA